MKYALGIFVAILCASCRSGMPPQAICVSNSARLAMVIGAVQNEGGVISCRVSEALRLTHPVAEAESARIIRPGQFIDVDLRRLGHEGYDPQLEPGDVLEVLTKPADNNGVHGSLDRKSVV